jgi:signal transduction histidine kinase/CheY-like chemotaxis protein
MSDRDGLAVSAVYQSQIDQLKANSLFQNNRFAVAVSLVNIAITFALFWSFSDRIVLMIWAGSLAVLGLVRWVYIRRHLRRHPKALNQSLNIITGLTLLSGIGWGLPLYLLDPGADPAATSVLMYIMAGMVAGAVIAFSSHIRVVLAFTIPAVGLTALCFVLEGGVYNLASAAVLVMFLAVSTGMTRRANATVNAAVRNKVLAENQTLEIAEMAIDLEKAVEAARMGSSAKSRFLANMSHEIRTPLNGVLGMTQLLERTALSAEQVEYASTIQSSGRSLLAVIDDVLDIARIDAGSMTLENEPFSLKAVLKSAQDTLRDEAEAKHVVFNLNIASGVPDLVLGDERTCRRIFVNLAGNAVKFSESGPINIDVSEAGLGRLCISISDSGPALTDDQCAMVFDRFAQADTACPRGVGGSGVGLAITKALVELAGGEVGVSSSPGNGSRFWVELPLPEPSGGAKTKHSVTSAEPLRAHHESWRILVVDDIPTNRLIAKTMLEKAGHVVIEAENGLVAIDTLGVERVDIVLMDIQMPVLAGDDAIRQIRTSGQAYHSVPIFSLTANASEDERLRLLNLGATGHVTKPFDLPAMLFEMEAALLARSDSDELMRRGSQD